MPIETYKIPLDLMPQIEGGYTVTSPLLPELITEGDTVEEALANAREVFEVVLEIYRDHDKPLPVELRQDTGDGPIHTDSELVENDSVTEALSISIERRGQVARELAGSLRDKHVAGWETPESASAWVHALRVESDERAFPDERHESALQISRHSRK